MQVHYDSRQLNIIKRRLRQFDPQKSINAKSRRAAFQSIKMQQTQFIQNQSAILTSIKKPKTLRQYIKKMKVRSYTMIFIQKLKRNRINMALPHNYSQPYIEYPSQTTSNDAKGFQINNKFKVILDLLTVFSIVFIQLFASFQMFFDDFRSQSQSYIWYFVLAYMVLCFICLRMVCGFTVKVDIYGMSIDKVQDIIKLYLKSANFWLDLALLVSIILMIIHPFQLYPGVVGYFSSLVNLIAFRRVQQAINFTVFTNNNQKQYFDLLKLFLANCFVSHITGTILLAITHVNPNQLSWMDKLGISLQPWSIKYIYAVYWAASIVFTVGFGDVAVANSNQAVLVLFIMMTGCLTLAYNISQVGHIISELTRIRQQVQNQLATLRRVALSSNIDKNLHHAISQYIIYAAEIKTTFQISQTRDLISMLPQQMRDDFIEQSSSNFFKGMPYFSYLSTKTKIKLSEKITLQIAAPGVYLTDKRHHSFKIYFIRKGKIGLAYRKKGSTLNGSILQTIIIESEQSPPELLNKYLLVPGQTLNYDVICQGYTNISILAQEQLHDCLKENPHDLQFFSQLRDSAKIAQDECSRYVCQNCGTNHSVFVCPKLHYMPYRSFVFFKSQKKWQFSKQFHLQQFQYIRQKPSLSKRYTLKLWKGVFKKIQYVLSINSKKKTPLSIKRVNSYDSIDEEYHKWSREFEINYLRKLKDTDFEVDQIHNFQNYFVQCNPKIIAQTPLDRLKEFLMFQRTNSNRPIN